MSDIFICGHRNPDLDSVCSAYAYAALKNKIDPENRYIPIRCGHLSENTKKIFAFIEINPPAYRKDIYPRVSDVLLTTTERLDADMPLTEVALSYKDSNPSVIPVYEGKRFYGLLSVDDITSWVMNELSNHGNVSSIPKIRDIMREQEKPIHVGDLFEEAKNKLSSSKKRGLAVFDDNGYVGYVTRRCFLRSPRNSVILVDHNEPRQSIRGIESANIVEIIDHHRLDAVKTDLPIFIDAEPLGSTCTIVYQMFLRHHVMPDPDTAKILLTGIISDTLILRSPTTTKVDIWSAEALAAICQIDLQDFGLKMFGHMEGLKTRDSEEAISADFKTYNERGVKFGIGQCEVTTLHDLNDYADVYLKTLEEIRVKNGLDWSVLMVTDVLREHSVLLCTEYRSNHYLPYTELRDGIYDMPGVMSRKKQLLPELTSSLGV